MDRLSGVLLHSIPPDAKRLGIPRAFVHLSECQFDRLLQTQCRHAQTHGYTRIQTDTHRYALIRSDIHRYEHAQADTHPHRC